MIKQIVSMIKQLVASILHQQNIIWSTEWFRLTAINHQPADEM